MVIRLPDEVRTERLLLRQWRDDDLEPLFAIYQQPEYLAHMPARDFEQTRAQLDRFRRAWADDGFCQWAVEELDSGRFVGRVGIIRQHDFTPRPSAPEVGWTLDRAVFGRGYATEAGRASLELWRERLVDDAQLISITTPDNARSRAVMERLGLTLRGTTFWHDHDVVWYAMDRDSA